MRYTLALTIAAAATSVASIAHAQQQYGYSLAEHHRGFHDGSGIEMAIHGGGGGFLNDSSTAFRDQPRAQDHLYWPGFGGQTEIGWRFRSYVSLTGHFTYQNNQPRDLPLGTTDGWANSYAVGINLRAYIGSMLHIRVVDPWVAVGFDPWAAVYAGHATPLGNANNRFTAVAVPMSIGLDFNVVRQVALGVMGQASPWFAWEGCSNLPTQGEVCTRDGLANNWYGFIGATARFTVTR